MFRGVAHISLDAKGRMAFPSRYRERLQSLCDGQVVVTVDPNDHCLLIYPLPGWEEIEHKLESLPTFNPAARRLQRLLIGHATEGQLDGNGRILVPPPLRRFAYIEKRTVLIGQGRKFELWDEATWESKRDQWLAEASDLDDLPADVGSLSI